MLHQFIFHRSFKKQSYYFRKVKPDDKDGNWLTLSYRASERPSFWERLQREFFELLPTESLTASSLSQHLAVNFLPDLGFSAFLLRLFTELMAWNLFNLFWCWQKKDTLITKRLIKKHIYSSNRNKIQVNQVRQLLVCRRLRVQWM